MSAKYIQLQQFTRQERLGFAALCFICAIILLVFLLPLLLPLDPYTNHLDERLQMPSGKHVFGTDQNGRDVFARIIYGGRISLIIGILTTLLAFTIGVSLGVTAGVMGGTADLVIVQLIDISFAVPSLLLAIAAAAILRGQDLRIAADKCPELKAFLNTLLEFAGLQTEL